MNVAMDLNYMSFLQGLAAHSRAFFVERNQFFARANTEQRIAFGSERTCEMKPIRLLCTAALLWPLAGSAAQLDRLDYDDGVYFRANAAGYEFTIGCAFEEPVEFRLDVLTVPDTSKTPGASTVLRFLNFDGEPQDFVVATTYSTDQGRDVLIGAMPLNDDLALALESAIGLRASTQSGDVIIGDSMDGFDDVLFFMEEYCH